MSLPLISVIIPTRNSSKTLSRCLNSIFSQNYPKDRIELIIIDAFSTDDTVRIARDFGAKIYYNQLIRAEPGKALGAKVASGELLLFVDSDNILCSRDWLSNMVEPLLVDNSIFASEALYYGYDRSEHPIIRYCALMGADNPVTVYLGFYGRYSHLRNKWTDISLPSEDRDLYTIVELKGDLLPTMGANGFLVRTDVLKRAKIEHLLIDVDLIYDLVKLGYERVARVKVAVSHLYASSFSQYVRKTLKIARYLFNDLEIRKFPWTKFDKRKFLSLVFGVLTMAPLMKDAIVGYKRKPDIAWFLNYPLCLLVLAVYGTYEFLSGFRFLRKR